MLDTWGELLWWSAMTSPEHGGSGALDIPTAADVARAKAAIDAAVERARSGAWSAVTVRCFNRDGTPAMCYRCGEPAQTFINTSVNLASSVPSHMEPVCAEHDPYRRTFTPDNTQLRADLQAARDAGRTLAAYVYSIMNPGAIPESVKAAMRRFEG